MQKRGKNKFLMGKSAVSRKHLLRGGEFWVKNNGTTADCHR
jgi:hypothetical protein